MCLEAIHTLDRCGLRRLCLEAIHTLDRCGLRRLCVLRQYTHWTVWSLTPCSIFCNDSSGDRVQCVHWPSTTQCNCKWHVHSTKDTVQVYSLIQCRYFHLHSTGVFVASLPATSQRYLHRRCASSLMLYRYFPWHCTGVFIIQNRYLHLYHTEVFVASLPATSQKYLHW